MEVLIGAKACKEIIETLVMYDEGLADTLAVMTDPKLQQFLKESKKVSAPDGL